MSGFEMVNRRLLKISFDWDSSEAATMLERLGQKKIKTIIIRIYNTIEKGKKFIAKI
jgi:hypothetical protein